MSLSSDLPTAIRAFVDATNAGDSAAFVAVFTADAFLSDGPTLAGSGATRSGVTAERVGRGKEFRGHEGVESWNESDDIGRQAHFEVLSVRPGDTETEVVATVVVTGGGFNGTSDLAFTLRGDEVARLVIAP